MRERHRALAIEHASGNGLKLLSDLFRRPLVNVGSVAELLDVTFPTANRLVAKFHELGLLTEVTGQRRSRVFRYDPYLRLFDDAVPDADSDTLVQTTERSDEGPASYGRG